MINKLPKKIMKKVYHVLTSGNADIAFYSEAYLTNNSEWVMKRPIKFALHLLKINITCRIPHMKHKIEGLIPGKKCIARIFRRPKVYQYAVSLMRFQTIITDVFHSLVELTIDYNMIYQLIEEQYEIPGFYKLRKKKENSKKSITEIYTEISKELKVTINKEVELNYVKSNLVANKYLKKAFEIAMYNKIPVLAVIETSYSSQDVKELLSEVGIQLTDIRVSNERKLTFYKMIKEYIRTYQLESQLQDDNLVVVSANYNRVIKPSRRHHIAPVYYRSSKEIMKSIPMPELSKEFQEVYQTITGLELFSGLVNHKNLYELTYLYLAPAIYGFLTKVNHMATLSGAKVIGLCDTDCIFIELYERYFGEITSCIWSGLASGTSENKEEWMEVINDNYLIESYEADRIAYALGFEYHNQILHNCKDEFVETALTYAKKKSENTIINYVKDAIGVEKKLLIVDPMPGYNSINSFEGIINGINKDITLDKMSLSEYLLKDAKELNTLHRILQMDSPFLIGIYQDELSFVQPRFVNEAKKKTIYAALNDFCRNFATFYPKAAQEKMLKNEDINKILDYSSDALNQFEDVIGGGIK